MKALSLVVVLSLLTLTCSAQESFSSATMEVKVEVISGTTVQAVQPVSFIVKDEDSQKVTDGLFEIRASEGVDYEVTLSNSSELINEFGESLNMPFRARKVFDKEDLSNNVYITPANPEMVQSMNRGSYEGTVSTQIYYM